jgi:hypothetical protein
VVDGLAALMTNGWQAPPAQVPPRQLWLQAPQWLLSVLKLKHGLLGEHAVPAVQHTPLVHVPAQLLPHPPQLAALVCVSTQAPLQYVWPVRQQVPLVQVPLHTLPHAPQLAKSVLVSLHAPLQLLCPAAQHRPSTHVLLQVWLHPPQWAALALVSTHSVPHAV